MRAPVEVKLALLAVLLGVGDMLNIVSKYMRNRQGIDVRATLKNKLLKQAATRVVHDEVARTVLEHRKDYLRSKRMSKLGPVQVTLEGMRVAADKQIPPEAGHDVREEPIDRVAEMYTNPPEERAVRVEALEGAQEIVMAAGTDNVMVKRLSLVVLDTRVDAFRRALIGEPAGIVEPLAVELKRDTASEQVRTKRCQMTPENVGKLESQVQQLQPASMVRLNRGNVCECSDGFSQGAWILDGGRLPGGEFTDGAGAMANARSGDDIIQIEGSSALCSLDILRGYWQMPLAEETQNLFSILLPSKLYMATKLPQGILNARSSFQSTMAEIVRGIHLKR